MSPGTETRFIRDRGRDRCCDQRSNTWNFDETSASLAVTRRIFHPSIEVGYTRIHRNDFVDQHSEDGFERRVEALVLIVNDEIEELPQPGSLNLRNDTILR